MVKSIFRKDDTSSVAVLGLGRFGSALALELEDMGIEVLGIDSSYTVVQQHAPKLTQAVRADVTNEEALSQLGVPEFSRAVVAIGSNLEVSILAASNCLSFGVESVWAKAVSEAQGRILTQLGVHKVIYPHSETGRRAAHMIGGAMLEYQAYSDGFVMFTAPTPVALTGRPLAEIGFRRAYGLNVVAVKHPGGKWVHTDGSEVLTLDDIIMVTGPQRAADKFQELH